ncbi:mitochondrial peptide methionine sulfoxide reductase isoform X3 [Mesocricetus auratus]|uniref:peptide-methionine (S)-S-oxide reductase n=1 Tax=Mesocricetus auratus TaxID=10036 RepID=A0ABM2X0R0_MESAU|nr:mitochondrial peptide methionine sulfoxide reductase isoform X3 [Mesocricetus auratus]
MSKAKHHVSGNRTVEPFPEGTQMAVFGMGCFWGAERKFWLLKGVYSTQVGFAGGYTRNPTYKEVCSDKTGHAEVVRVVYQPEHISFEELLKVFWENHDPTQGMRQGNDYGTQYRSAIYPTSNAQMETALRSKEEYQKVLTKHMSVVPPICKLLSKTSVSCSVQGRAPWWEAAQSSVFPKHKCDILFFEGGVDPLWPLSTVNRFVSHL